MATRVYDEEEIFLQDGTEVTIRPNVIGRMRRFMKAWDKVGDAPEGQPPFDVFINCAGISLEENFKGKFESLKASKDEAEAGEFLSAEYKEYLEDVLDLETIYRILAVCGSIDLKDPKLQEMAQEALGTN